MKLEAVLGPVEIRVRSGETRKMVDYSSNSLLLEEVAHLEEIRKPLLLELRNQEIRLRTVNDYKKKFTTHQSIPLRELAQDDYTVYAARRQSTRFGETHKLLVEVDGEIHVVWSNAKINSVIDSIPEEKMKKMLDSPTGVICYIEKELATLSITGRGTNSYGHTTVFCKFIVKDQVDLPVREVVHESKNQCQEKELTALGKEDLLPYREYSNLTALPLGSTNKVSAIGYAKSYGGERLVVKIGETFYQAGEDVEKKIDQIKLDCILKIDKIRLNLSRRTKYASCLIYEPGDWTAFVDFSKTPMLLNRDGSTCVLDVKSIEVKGKKRKLLLTDKGAVYKLKQSKLEDSIKPGYL